jgi:hypothetical protein
VKEETELDDEEEGVEKGPSEKKDSPLVTA